MAGMLTTMPVRGALGMTNWVGTTKGRSAPDSHGSTLGFARKISSYPTLKRRAMSVSVSSLEVFTICTTPITSSSGATSKRCVATGAGSTGGGGGAGGGGGSTCFGAKSEQAVSRVHKQAAIAARIREVFISKDYGIAANAVSTMSVFRYTRTFGTRAPFLSPVRVSNGILESDPLTDSEARVCADYFSALVRLGWGWKSNIRAVTSVGNVRTSVLKLFTAAI